MQWRRVHAQSSTVLNFTTPSTVHQKPWKGVQRRGQLSRVNGTIKMQQALNIQTNAKSDPFPNLLFFLQNCGHRKAATDPRTQVQQLPSNKKWFHFSPRVCDFSLLVVLMRIFLKETTCIIPPGSWESSYSQPGRGTGDGGRGTGDGEVKWTLKKD